MALGMMLSFGVFMFWVMAVPEGQEALGTAGWEAGAKTLGGL